MRAAAAAWLLPALLVSSCAPPEPARPGPAATKVRFVFRLALSNAAVVIAAEDGYFRKQGLDVELVELGRNQDALPSLIEGKVDVIAGSVNPGYFNAIAKGAELRIVAEMGHLDPAGCTYAALVARKGLLRDGKLGSPGPPKRWRVDLRRGSLSEFILEKALAQERISPDSVEIDFLPANAEIEALQKGAIDVVMGLGSRLEQSPRDGAGVIWHRAETLTPNFPFVIVVYGPSLLKRDPEAGRRFMVAYLQAVRQYNEGKTEHNLKILRARLGLDRETLEQSCWIPIGDEARIDVESLLEFQAWARGKGLLDRVLAAEEFWEPRFIESALRSGALEPERR